MEPEAFQKMLCATFCQAFQVRAVPVGLVVATPFVLDDGDNLSFYVRLMPEGVALEDDGAFLAHLIASGVPFDQGVRGNLLHAILREGHAYWDQDTLEIKTETFSEYDLGQRSVAFISALLRSRDLQNLTRDMIKSTFREDVIAAAEQVFRDAARIEEDTSLDRDFREFPSDIIIRPTEPGVKSSAVYLVNSNDKLNEALLCHVEAERLLRDDVQIIALLEDSEMRSISKKRFQRAQNRSLLMPIFRGDEFAALQMVGSRAGFSREAIALPH